MYTSYELFLETDVPTDELIISRTDLEGNITYVNEVFALISGYDAQELITMPHSVVRHPDMPRSVYKDLWDVLKSGKIWRGYVKNLRKDRGYYWVYAEVSGVYKDGVLVEYKSIRTPIENALKKFYQDKYDTQREKEESTCRVVATINAQNIKKLRKFAKEEGVNEDTILNKILEDNLF